MTPYRYRYRYDGISRTLGYWYKVGHWTKVVHLSELVHLLELVYLSEMVLLYQVVHLSKVSGPNLFGKLYKMGQDGLVVESVFKVQQGVVGQNGSLAP